MPASIRLAAAADLAAINDIYNHYVPISTATYDYEAFTLEQRAAWFANRPTIHPVTVAERDGLIVGWGALGVFRTKHGYRHTVENSVYIHPQHQRQGIGAAILADLVQRARQLGLHAIVAGIDATHASSIALHAKYGFIEVARFREVGYKFDR